MLKARTLRKCTLKLLFITLGIAFLFPISAFNAVYARDSVYTQNGTGPLYWTPYEYNLQYNQFMPENVWKTNVDWFAANFQPYGYDTVCTDGWGDPTNCPHNQYGYQNKRSSQWVNGYSYWSNYLNSLGLKFGLYLNPLWIPKSVYDDPNAIVEGTNIPIRNICNTNDMFDPNCYWVQVNNPGAEQYVKGYINYLKSQGVKMLRVDFLSWYEDGTDHGNVVGVNHGTAAYDLALSWMRDACGSDMELSLVMPHLKNNATTELKYGDMARINEDVGTGAWDRFSDMNRGIHYNYWSQYSNAFDGLIYWSQYFGKGKMISDADFLRLNTFSNDAERKSAVSLCAMAGAPIAVADQYNTIGSSAWIYQNSEIINLNKQGFVGKPLKSEPNNAVDSQRWVGMLPDGSWVVGLFNRENTTQHRGIDFAENLGIYGNASVRDLWNHTNLGSMSSYSVDLSPHSCTVIKVTPDSGSIKNGGFETRDISGWTEWHPSGQAASYGVDSNDAHSGQNKLYFWNTNAYQQSVHQIKTGLANGSYKVKAWVKSTAYGGTPNYCRMELTDYGGTAQYTNMTVDGTWRQYTGTVNVTNGQLSIGFYCSSPGSTSMQIDDVQLIPVTSPESLWLTNPGFEKGDITGWTEWHPYGQAACYGVDSSDIHSGQYKLYFWSTNAYQQSVHQIPAGLSSGSYTVKAWVKATAYGGQPSFCRMELAEYGGTAQYINMNVDGSWHQYTGTVNVTNGQLNIGFYCNSPGSTSMQIDDVQFFKN
ncbi:MAG: carbohydrate binding domain-containing protein [Bacillota bacterium]|nr:carbohydrate binding domain-containing protein [Bacillota bacterium]